MKSFSTRGRAAHQINTTQDRTVRNGSTEQGRAARVARTIGAALLAGGTIAGIAPVAATAHAADQTTYYVSCNGSDNAAGTSPSTAWRTLTRASQASLRPGDRMELQRGCVWNGQRLDVTWSGRPGAEVRISNYGEGDKPLIKNGPNSNVKITGSWVIVNGLVSDFDAIPTVACAGGGQQPVDMRYGFNFTGGAKNSMVRNSVARHATAGVHLSVDSSKIQVLDNELTQNNVMSTWGADPSKDLGAWGVLVDSDDNEIAGNTFRNNEANCRNQGYKLASNSVEVHEGSRNWIHHNTSSGDRVFSELGSSGREIASDNRFENNTFVTAEPDSRFITTRGSNDGYGPVRNTVVKNNSTYQTGAGSEGVVCGGSCGPSILTLRGNVLWAENKAIYADGDATVGANVVWSSSRAPVVQFAGAAPAGAGQIIVADPGYVNPAANDLRLRGPLAGIVPLLGA